MKASNSAKRSRETKEKKNKIFASQEAITEAAKYPREQKSFTIVTFKMLKLYQVLHICLYKYVIH